jgi:hypothetical protein
MKTVILAVLLFLPFFSRASYEDYRLSIYADTSDAIAIGLPRSQAQSMFYRLARENSGKIQVISEMGNLTTYKVQSTQHSLFSCQLFEYSPFNGPNSNTFDCEFKVNVSWSTYRSASPTDYQDIKDYTFEYDLNKPFQWKGDPAKALFEQLVVGKYYTEKSEVVGATTTVTRTVPNLGCALKSDSGIQEYSCWIEN